MIQGYAQNLNREPKFIDSNLKLLKQMSGIVTEVAVNSIRPSVRARGLVDTCMTYSTARRILRGSCWDKLLRSYEFQVQDVTFEVVILEQDQAKFR